MIELIIAFFLGIAFGTFTGLMPGIHVNLVCALLLPLTSKLDYISPEPLVVFIVSMSITHTFLDFIPSIFLGAPEEDTFLAVLPGHQMLLQGQGYQAVVLTLYGSLFALLVILLISPLYYFFLPSLYEKIKYILPFILIGLLLYTFFRENKLLPAFLIILLSSLLGLLTFSLPVKEPLLPLLTGLFGLSSLILSVKNKQKIKKQKITPLRKISLNKEEIRNSSLAAFISTPFCSFLPGIGSGHAAFIGSEIFPQTNKSFLFLVGSINTVVMALSFVTLYTIDRSRSGSAAAIQQILDSLSTYHLFLIMFVIFTSAILSFFLSVYVAKSSVSFFNRINYSKVSLAVIILLCLITLGISNLLGFLVLITSTSIGFLCVQLNVKRIHLMSSLIIPSIISLLT